MHKFLVTVFLIFFVTYAMGEDIRLEVPINSFTEYQITQKLDHFNPEDKRSFELSYLTNGRRGLNGPIFMIIVDNVDHKIDIAARNGLIQKLAQETDGYVVHVEVRFSEHSMPENYTDPEVLKYFTIEQQLEDLRYLIERLTNSTRTSDNKVIVIGYDYNGNIATWLRQKYPDIVHAAVAIEAPLIIKLGIDHRFETLSRGLKNKDKNCFDTMKEGFKEFVEAAKNNDSTTLKEVFNFCSLPKLNSEDITIFLIQYFQKFKLILGSSFDKCENLANMTGTSLEKIGKLALQIRWRGKKGSCIAPGNLKKLVSSLKTDNVLHKSVIRRTYPKCMLFGNEDISNDPDSLFSDYIPFSYYADHECPEFFGKEFSGDKIISSIKNTIDKFSGNNPNVTNALFVYGEGFQNRKSGVREDFSSELSEVLTVDYDMIDTLQGVNADDTDRVKEDKMKIKQRMLSWLQ